METFEEAFGALPDPRAKNTQHDLLEIVFIGLAATLCGAQNCVEMALFARSKEEFLRNIIDMPNGPASHDTFSRVFRLLDARAFETAFMSFTRHFAGKIEGVVAIDGKALRGAYERGARHAPLHLVNVWAAQARLVITQRLAPGRNEVAGVLEALALLDLDDCIVTADALHCRKDIARAIVERGGHYALAVKGNQPRLLAKVKQALATHRAPMSISEVEEGHDRSEIRRAKILCVPELEKDHGFAAACAVASIEAVRQSANGTESVNTRYFILSTCLQVEQMAAVARAHWGIENNLHWVLDVAFNEDKARNRTGHGPQNLSLLRKLALNIINTDQEKGSIKGKIKRAGWDNAFLTKLVGHMR